MLSFIDTDIKRVLGFFSIPGQFELEVFASLNDVFGHLGSVCYLGWWYLR